MIKFGEIDWWKFDGKNNIEKRMNFTCTKLRIFIKDVLLKDINSAIKKLYLRDIRGMRQS